MAGLAWGELKKRGNYITFRDKINSGEPFAMVTGSPIVLNINGSDPKKGKDYLAWFNRLNANRPGPPPGDYPLIDNNGERYSLGKLQKTSEFGGAGFNVGNTGEGIFAAAIAARFRSKTKSITDDDVIKVIKDVTRNIPTGTPVTVTQHYKSANEQTLVKDKLNLEIELSQKDMIHLRDDIDKYRDVLSLAADYANDRKVRRWADLLYKNNVVNTINVKSLGVSGATKTKVDTWVEIGSPKIRPRKVNINISLKVGDTKQFGQIGGMAFSGQQDMFSKFGITIPTDIETDFTKLVGDNKSAEAFQLSFSKAEAYTGWTSETVGKGIVYWATLNEKVPSRGVERSDTLRNIELAQIKSTGTTILRFRGAVNKIAKATLNVKKTTGDSGLPTLEFWGATPSAKKLVQIRVKKSGYSGGRRYFRTIVEKGPHLEDLIGETISIPLENQG